MLDLSRRTFLGQTAAATAALSAANWARAAGSNERATVALIGCGGMGGNHLRLLASRQDLRLKSLCDVDQGRLTAAAKSVEGMTSPMPATLTDMRRVFDDPDIDAVWIATPDHWHSPAAILAVTAGKHVYVEKPVSHNLREGRLLLEAARKHNRVVQVGTQCRSTAHVMRAMQLLREGIIGDVLVAKAWNSQLRRNLGKTQPSDPPPGLDYDLWLGPAPYRPYRSNMLPGVWRFWRDFGVGDIGNDGVHDIDIARWGLGVETHPSTIGGLGTKLFFDDDQEFPDTYYTVFEYPGDGQIGHKKQLIYEQRDWSPYVQEGHENGNAFYGTKGMLILGKGKGFQVFGPRNKLIEEGTGSPDLAAHHQNFLDCVRTGGRPNADVEIGHLSASLCHLANIACRVTRTLQFDPAKEAITGDAEAHAMLRRTYREGHWAVPKGV
jgi:predicted dehydrogenase